MKKIKPVISGILVFIGIVSLFLASQMSPTEFIRPGVTVDNTLAILAFQLVGVVLFIVAALLLIFYFKGSDKDKD